MTRTRRIAGSVALGLATQVATVVVGFWLTRFILDRIGVHDYGVWLVLLQFLGYLALADLGVVAILPRQAALLTGGTPGPGALRSLVGETARLIVWQWPFVIALSAAAWLLLPADWDTSRGPLAIMLAVFAIAFPLRLFGAVLQGLQEMVFLGWVQLATWMASTIVSVVALTAGFGLYSLSLAWGVLQLVPPVLCLHRLGTRYPDLLPRNLPHLGWDAARRHLGSAAWVSLGQLSSILVYGADLLIIGTLLGATAVVPYAVTLKLISVVANAPVMLAHASGPGLSQLRAGDSRDSLRRATGALTQGLLAMSGGVACVVVAVNQGFVGWWLDAGQYAGTVVTLAATGLMLLRHYATASAFALFSFGHERLTAMAGIVEGAVTVVASIVLVRAMGPVGAVFGALIAVTLFTLPMILPTLARETGTTVGGVLRIIAPFALRIAIATATAHVIGSWFQPTGPFMLVAAALLSAAIYTVLMLPVALRPPLRDYVVQLVGAIRARIWPSPPTPSTLGP